MEDDSAGDEDEVLLTSAVAAPLPALALDSAVFAGLDLDDVSDIFSVDTWRRLQPEDREHLVQWRRGAPTHARASAKWACSGMYGS